MFGNCISLGSWWISSKSNPEWNARGRDYVGGFVMPSDAEKKIEELTKKLGPPPKDLKWEYMKD